MASRRRAEFSRYRRLHRGRRPPRQAGARFPLRRVIEPNDADLELIDQIGIRFVADLRAQHESGVLPSRWPMEGGATVHRANVTLDLRLNGRPLIELIVENPCPVSVVNLTNERIDVERVIANTIETYRNALGIELTRAAIEPVTLVQAGYIDGMFDGMEREYGSADGYLRRFGIDAGLVEALRGRLLER